MEPRFGVDFGGVRIHTGADAIQMNRALGAQAFTHGSDIYFGSGHGPNDLALTAHELAHVVQQTGGVPLLANGPKGTSSTAAGPSVQRRRAPAGIQRRLIVSGSSEALVNEYLTLVGTAAGLRLNWTFAQPRVTAAGNRPGGVPSASARSDLTRVINHATQHAELHIGTNQPRVGAGAFPGAGSTIQTIDMDDIRNINASLPGQGTAKAFHEMMENFNAHGIGFGNFGASHAVGVEEESNILEQQGIVGRRLGAGFPRPSSRHRPGSPRARTSRISGSCKISPTIFSRSSNGGRRGVRPVPGRISRWSARAEFPRCWCLTGSSTASPRGVRPYLPRGMSCWRPPWPT